MNLPTEITLTALLADTDLLAKVRYGELVARVRGDVRPIKDVYYLPGMTQRIAYIDNGEYEYGYGVQKRVVISEE